MRGYSLHLFSSLEYHTPAWLRKAWQTSMESDKACTDVVLVQPGNPIENQSEAPLC
jgi:hypothetical protein